MNVSYAPDVTGWGPTADYYMHCPRNGFYTGRALFLKNSKIVSNRDHIMLHKMFMENIVSLVHVMSPNEKARSPFVRRSHHKIIYGDWMQFQMAENCMCRIRRNFTCNLLGFSGGAVFLKVKILILNKIAVASYPLQFPLLHNGRK